MRNLPIVLMIVFVGTVLSISLWRAKADQPKSENPASDSNDVDSLEIRLAQSHLKLAKLDLRRAMEGNKRIPKMLPATVIEKLRLHVIIDEEQLEQCLMGEAADSHQICIRRAQAAVKIAEADVKRKRTMHESLSDTFSELDSKRAEVVAKLAKLNLERTQNLKDSEAVWTHMQWQIDELRHQILELHMQLKL